MRNGDFSIGGVYLALKGEIPSWNKLQTRDRLASFGMTLETKCVLCGREEESRDHIFFRCLFSQVVVDGALQTMGLRQASRDWMHWWPWVLKVRDVVLHLIDVSGGTRWVGMRNGDFSVGGVNKLQTRDKLASFGMTLETKCVLCGREEESRDHIFFRCLFSQVVVDGALQTMGHADSSRDWMHWWPWVLKICKGKSRLAHGVRTYRT
ncbi:hypothetical protein Dimus_023878 [Dionaea muscipula]